MRQAERYFDLKKKNMEMFGGEKDRQEWTEIKRDRERKREKRKKERKKIELIESARD